ncbi:Acetyltransferase (GNAT) domain-containing protein [Mesonia phycicola]|uniref:Acetyltransferase (GNAT) domain-containing protein n=1 Tax=Mesonia phycicola TaxID=579105 RepID=A0A1M6E2X5_9FLAO|nr:GNAT family N-acetyltransferase [Mesonia phycicola]SHI79755.1 Acetyltransferase (GNAT) domain-containing protein [Mesonia phycicola]
MNLEIIEFTPALATHFASLNLAWLEKDFVVEPHDKEVLLNCKEEIIEQGGKIFFAKYQETIVGTFALLKLNAKTIELTKMAVHENYRGKKIGQFMLKYFQQYANDNSNYEYLLYSNKFLKNAIYLYHKFGFQEAKLEKNPPYKRADIKMIYKPQH